MGSLGADKLSAPRHTDALRLDNSHVARGWKIQSLNKSVDSILASATRLELEIEKETKYWEQILTVSDAGWSLSRLPNEGHTLGVRFGFAECMFPMNFPQALLIETAAPAFKNQSLAALRRNPDGTIYLDQGITHTKPRALRVRISSSSTETGSSNLPLPLPEDASIESTILQARNAIFDDELWQEINRESRTLGAYGVRAQEDTVSCPLTEDKSVVIDLVPLGDSFPSLGQPDDQLAEGICLALHLFLSCAHRQKYRRRTQIPPPISNQKQNTEPYSLLRPLITRLNHQSAVASAHRLFKPLCAVLASTKITPVPTYEVEVTPQSAALINSLSVTEATILSLTDRLETVITFKVTETTTIIVNLRTTMYPVCTTNHAITLSLDSPLNITCKPPRSLDQWGKVEEYVLFATSCAIASTFTQSSSLIGEAATWQPTIAADVLRSSSTSDASRRGKQLWFHTEVQKDTAKLRTKWEYMSSVAGYGGNQSSGKVSKKERGSYEWKSDSTSSKRQDWEDGEGEVVRSLYDVVEDAGRS